jgi:potassium/hydrogen antiporter
MPLSKLSVVLQGSMLPVMAKWLHVIVPEKVRRKFPLDLELKENSKSELLEIDIPENSKTVGGKSFNWICPRTH